MVSKDSKIFSKFNFFSHSFYLFPPVPSPWTLWPPPISTAGPCPRAFPLLKRPKKRHPLPLGDPAALEGRSFSVSFHRKAALSRRKIHWKNGKLWEIWEMAKICVKNIEKALNSSSNFGFKPQFAKAFPTFSAKKWFECAQTQLIYTRKKICTERFSADEFFGWWWWLIEIKQKFVWKMQQFSHTHTHTQLWSKNFRRPRKKFSAHTAVCI